MSSSFFLPNQSSSTKLKSSGQKRKYEGNKQGKSKVKKKFVVGNKNKNKEKDHFSKGKALTDTNIHLK